MGVTIVAFNYSTQTSSRVVLPSYLARKRHQKSVEKPCKQPKHSQSWDRDIVCLPSSQKRGMGVITYPCGKYRTWLAKKGLIGKVHLESAMTEDDVWAEVS